MGGFGLWFYAKGIVILLCGFRMDLSYKYGSVGYIKNTLHQCFCPRVGMEEHDKVS